LNHGTRPFGVVAWSVFLGLIGWPGLIPNAFLVWGGCLLATSALTVAAIEPERRLFFVPSILVVSLIVWLGYRYLRKTLA
jgi:hypothetical protein